MFKSFREKNRTWWIFGEISRCRFINLSFSLSYRTCEQCVAAMSTFQFSTMMRLSRSGGTSRILTVREPHYPISSIKLSIPRSNLTEIRPFDHP